ncbi:MAG: UPF0147 family protein [Candidatus Heimdallarchaeota archaeon]|nr:UPF0147 family protein [Candidatus Heimdallarchaeota archaeon]
MSTAENQVKEAIEILANISEDTAIPRNIRRVATQSQEILQDESLELAVRAINAIEMLEDTTGDPNCPNHARTLIWHIITRLELPTGDDDWDDDEYYDEDDEDWDDDYDEE